MEKEGKVDILSILVASILIFVVYAVMVLGDGVKVDSTFPEDGTNASATYGYSPNALNSTFNATNATFHCNAGTNGSSWVNLTNVSLFISNNGSAFAYDGATSAANQTQNTTAANYQHNTTFIFNITAPTAFDEGVYFWFCRAEDNSSTILYNTSTNRSFTIDKTGPFLTTNVTNTSNAAVSTGDTVYIAVNFSDQFTTIHTVRLFVNSTGTADNEVNITEATSGVIAGNNTQVNLSFVIPGFLLNDVLNFTFQVNDSVNNINISPAVVFRVDGDGTPPGITLNKPIDLFNQSSASVSFNFTAVDNNETGSITCSINISQSGTIITSLANIAVTNGTPQINSTTLSNGTYQWSVNCTDGPGNVNTSIARTLTVDNIPPALIINITINGTGANPFILGNNIPTDVPVTGDGSWAQGRQFIVRANFTDNLTKLLEADLQYYDESGSNWVTVNTTKGGSTNFSNSARNANGSVNLTFVPTTGHTYFEGRNVSFRVIANDSVGNVNNSASVYNVTIMINDTASPNITITLPISNGTNQSSTILKVNWSIDEGNSLVEINISVDGVGISSGFDPNSCNKYKRYHTGTPTKANEVRNFTLTTTSGFECGLTNGSHYVVIQATDSWGNSFLRNTSFNVQSGSVPGLVFNLTNEDATGIWIKDAINKSNITSSVGIGLSGTNGVGGSIDKISYFSSCDSTVRLVINATTIYPFNASSCNTQSGNRTLTVTINDTAGNFNTTVLGFTVDNVAPTMTIHSPIDGFSTTGAIDVNVSAFDSEGQVQWIKYYLDGGETLFNVSLNKSLPVTGDFGRNSSIVNRTVNFTAGTHTIRISVNDTLGNIRNSSEITFTYLGPFNFLTVNQSLSAFFVNYSNTSVFNSSGGLISDTSSPRPVSETYVLFLALNYSATGGLGNINISINFNGSAANWDAINFSVKHNDSTMVAGIENNFTAKVVEVISFNTSAAGTITGSVDDFLTDSNSYYGFIDLTLNATNVSNTVSGSGSLGGTFELWYFTDETSLNSKQNITECSTNKVITHKTVESSIFPCWNNTLNDTVRVYVPHFSAVALVNDTISPTVTRNTPASTQGISGFIPNITVSFDAVSCEYILNITDTTKIDSVTSNVSSSVEPVTVGSNNICTFSEIRFKNDVYNITYNVTDANGNINLTSSGAASEGKFTVSDGTAPNTGTSISTGSISSTSAKVTISGVNESVNVTVAYGTTNTSLTSTAHATDFEKTQTVTIPDSGDLTAGTTYYYNVTVFDFAGNSNTNSTVFSFKTSAAGTTTTTTTTTTTGGGGGAAAAVSNVADSKAQVWSIIPAGSSVSLNVDKATIAITSVAVSNVKSELKNVDIEVQALKSNPVSATAAGKVFQYLRINKKQIVDGDAESIKISFRVTKAWLTENGLTSADVRLYRYKDSVWNKLSTSVKSTDSTYVNFEAETPGFSFFAVGSATGGGDAFAIIDAIRGFYDGTSSLTAFEIIDMIRAFYG